jgi:hypothetical protein
MKAFRTAVLCLIVVLSGTLTMTSSVSAEDREIGWTDSFDFSGLTFSDTGRNRYWILEPGYQLVLKGVEDGDSVTLVITVLSETKEINNISTRVVEERESAGGELVEVSRNFFSFCPEFKSVFYFGEDVDIYKEGKITNHDGSWQAGESGFAAGLMMPGMPLLGASYYQEVAPQIAMDRARIISTDSTLVTPAGAFRNCLVVEESSPLEPNSREFKIYAPGIGLIKDGELLLTKYGIGVNQVED